MQVQKCVAHPLAHFRTRLAISPECQKTQTQIGDEFILVSTLRVKYEKCSFTEKSIFIVADFVRTS